MSNVAAETPTVAKSRIGAALAAIVDCITFGALRRMIGRSLRMHHVYYMLAAFDVLAVGTGFYLSHRMNTLYTESVSVNQGWAGHIRSLSRLGDAAQATNAPGNDVFDTQDVPKERARRDEALAKFETDLNEIGRRLTKTGVASLTQSVREIRGHMYEMVAETDLIFELFAMGRGTEAGERMATMDRKYANVTRAINDSNGIIQDIQSAELSGQLETAAGIRQYEYLIGALILCMVFGVALFGHRMSATLKRAEAQRRAAAEELKAINEQVTNLNVELADRILELKEAQEEMIKKGKLAQLGQLTATVAHEIRNPLGAIKTSAQLIELKLQNKNLGIEKSMERINKAITRCDSIITELLGFTRSRALNVGTATVDQWVMSLIEDEARNVAPGVSVTTRLALPGLAAQFDTEQMRRVLINLLSNAAEAMVGKGTAKVKNPTVDPRIEVSTVLSAAGDIEIRVKDNGPGISEENLKKILEPLFTTKSFGVGLGLPTVAAVLEQHGGGLKIESKVGEGAEFIAWFPHRMAAVDREPSQLVAAA